MKRVFIMATPVKMLIGPGHPIEAKIQNARELYAHAGRELLRSPGVARLLEEYRQAVRESWQAMDLHGVVAECTDCAINDGGSCCGRGIEDKFDSVLLMINLLLGCRLPDARQDPEGCWFLGERGCLIAARHVICINYMCRRLYENLSTEDIHAVQQAMGHEIDLAFMMEQRIKTWLVSAGY